MNILKNISLTASLIVSTIGLAQTTNEAFSALSYANRKVVARLDTSSITLNALLGREIDLQEKTRYKILPYYEDSKFHSARFILRNDSTWIYATMNDNSKNLRHITTVEMMEMNKLVQDMENPPVKVDPVATVVEPQQKKVVVLGEATVVLPRPEVTDGNRLIIISPAVGETINQYEFVKYNIFNRREFPEKSFSSAQFIQSADGVILLRVKMKDGNIQERRSSWDEVAKCGKKAGGDQVDNPARKALNFAVTTGTILILIILARS